jgi:hypothetical protein
LNEKNVKFQLCWKCFSSSIPNEKFGASKMSFRIKHIGRTTQIILSFSSLLDAELDVFPLTTPVELLPIPSNYPRMTVTTIVNKQL